MSAGRAHPASAISPKPATAAPAPARSARARHARQTRCACGCAARPQTSELDDVATRRARGARDPEEVEGAERQTVGFGTQDGGTADAGPSDAGVMAGGAADGGTAPAAPSCTVASGPAYTPTGTIPLRTLSNGNRKASFSMAAAFGSTTARCCEVRQYIRWDERFHRQAGGPPHSGFPSSAAHGTWHEDRDTSDKRYGHRAGSHSDPRGSCGDEYLNAAGRRDQANGTRYCAKDGPEGFAADVGKWEFKLRIIDTCTGSERTSSSIITVNWG